ncbi:MAG TPA: hypothetical protein VF615_01635 [Longimicrobiaceae bacterium]|jgi:hypothetical protein
MREEEPPARTALSGSLDAWFNPVCMLPADEVIGLPSIWILEAYPTSYVDSLLEGIRRLGWDSHRRFRWLGDSSSGIHDARSGAGFSFVAFETMYPPGQYAELLGRPAVDLPAGCSRLVVRVHHPVPSTSVLVFQFVLDRTAGREVEGAFVREPPTDGMTPADILSRPGPRLREVEEAVQRVRRRWRDTCAGWVSSRLPGLFAETGGVPAAEFVTLGKALPLDHSGRDEPYLQALGLASWLGASELWGSKGLRLRSPFWSGPARDLLLAGREFELSDLEPTDDSGSVLDRVSSEVEDPLVRWALFETVRRYGIRLAGLRDRVGSIAGADDGGAARRLGDVQRAFMRLHADTVPLQREIVELCEDGTRYHREGGEFHLIDRHQVAPGRDPNVLEDVRQRTVEEAHRLVRISSDLREMVSTTGGILGAMAQERATEENLKLQRSVRWLAIFGLVATVFSVLAAI